MKEFYHLLTESIGTFEEFGDDYVKKEIQELLLSDKIWDYGNYENCDYNKLYTIEHLIKPRGNVISTQEFEGFKERSEKNREYRIL